MAVLLMPKKKKRNPKNTLTGYLMASQEKSRKHSHKVAKDANGVLKVINDFNQSMRSPGARGF